jgi:RNA polymerase sigma factor (sigma-70 family)
MTGSRPADILRQLDESGPPDAELLARFAGQRDQGAFAELVRRHGSLVWAACRRVAGHAQDAEDAFQAVFLILSREAQAIREPGLLGNWLYGVAVRVALKARRAATRRRVREVQVTTMPEPPDTRRPMPPGSPEFVPVLDEELAALPAWYRDAIVLCDLRGVSREEAARLLGIPEGTLSSRLANGRKKLAARLAKRGVVLSATAIPGVLASGARAAVPAELLARTCGVANGAVPAAVSRLASGDYPMTTKLIFGVLGAAAMVAGAVYASRDADPPQQAEPPKPVATAKAEPAPQQKPDPDAKPGDAVAFTTSPRLQRATDLRVTSVSDVSWSPDGKSLIVTGMSSLPDWKGRRVAVILTDVADERKSNRFEYPLAKSGSLARFTPDGKRIVTDVREYQLVSGRHELDFLEIDPKWAGGIGPVARVQLDATETHGYAFAPDGKTFRTVATERDATAGPTKLDVSEVDATTGKTLKSLLKVDYAPHVLSPDGKRLATLEKSGKVTVYDVDRGAQLATGKLPDPPAIAAVMGKGGLPVGPGGERESPAMAVFLSFSPDGRRLVVSRAIGQTVVLNADTGEALPALERTDAVRTVPGANAFTGDGRLLVLSGSRFSSRKGPGVPPWDALTQSGNFVAVWDTKTGKLLKSWDRSAKVAFNPVRPLLAILERNDDETRLGLRDFAAEVGKK